MINPKMEEESAAADEEKHLFWDDDVQFPPAPIPRFSLAFGSQISEVP